MPTVTANRWPTDIDRERTWQTNRRLRGTASCSGTLLGFTSDEKPLSGKTALSVQLWDGLPSHRSRLVRDFVAKTKGALVLERLPAYAPELNPVEYLWGYWKHHKLPNFAPGTSLNSAAMLAAPFNECAEDPVSLPLSGNRQAYFNVTILYGSQ